MQEKTQQERLQATIPKDNDWHLQDIVDKAKSYDLDKSDFILKGVGLLQNLDPLVFKEIQKKSAAMHIPEWLYIQNVMIKSFADDIAFRDVFKDKRRVNVEFMHIERGGERETVTGEILLKVLTNIFTENYENSKNKSSQKNEQDDLQEDIVNADEYSRQIKLIERLAVDD